MNSTREERPRRVPRFLPFIGIPLGLFFLAMGLNRPGIANMRTLDLLHLLAAGVCLGAGLVAMVLHFVDPHKA